MGAWDAERLDGEQPPQDGEPRLRAQFMSRVGCPRDTASGSGQPARPSHVPGLGVASLSRGQLMPGVQVGKERTALGDASRFGRRGLGCRLNQDSGL